MNTHIPGWISYRLSDIYTERKEPGNESLPLLTVSIHSGVSDGELDEDELPKKVKRIEDKSQYKRAATGDLVFNMMRAWQGAIGTVRTEGMVSPAYIVAKPNGKVYPPFMDYYMKAPRMVGMINRQSYGVTDFRKRLYWDSFAPIPCVLPPVREQKRIAEILSTQDKAIELQGRKIEELKRFKKGCLEKMFPRKRQKVPEKRFPGFTDDWEQRKLGSIYEAIGNAFVGTATPYYVENGHFYLESNNIKDGQINHNTEVFINDEFYEKQKDKWLHTGDMVMVQSGHVGHAAVIPEELDNSAAHALIMFRHPKIEIEPYFLNYQYQTLKSKKKIENITTGNTIKHILASDMQQFEVDMPKLEERKKIAEYFRGLDRLIALHQCKLEEMKRQKKALMQLLLMGIVRVKA